MDIILLQRVSKLGQIGDLVSVKGGYARNFLIPTGKALRASPSNIARFEAEKAQIEARNLETKKEAEDIASRLDGKQFVVIRSASDSGSLYGSVTSRDAAEAATKAGFSVNKKQIALTAPIKELGVHTLNVALHPEVEVSVTMNVARSQEEAQLQETGKSIKELSAEEEAAANFEISELFSDIGSAAAENDIGIHGLAHKADDESQM